MNDDARLSSIRRMAAGLAHDLNNILGGISSLASASLLEAPSGPIADDLRQIVHTAKEGLQIAARLAVIGHSAQPKITSIELASLLSVISRLFPQVEVSCPEPLSVQGDSRLLQETIIALVQNAVEASNNTITRVQVESHEGRVLLSITNQSTQLLKDLSVLSEPYYSTKAEGRCRGMGLLLAQAVARALGGDLSLQQLGQSVTVTLNLPQSPEHQEAPKAKPTILIADDEKPMRLALERLLSRAGYQVIAAAHGLETVELFEAHKADICLVILDRWMPQLNGIEVLREIRKQSATLPVFLLSGEIDPTEDINSQGATAYLEKPFDSAELLKLIQGTLRNT
jgi:two-component system, cell cycle sensor histidine kinase and response regulator CckA